MLTPAIEVYKPPLWQKDDTLDSNLGDASTSDLWQNTTSLIDIS